MITETQKRELSNVLLYANTPGYIYRNFRKAQIVKSVVDDYDEIAIINKIKLLSKSNFENQDQIIELLVLIISLSIKGTYEGYKLLKSIKTNNDWIAIINSRCLAAIKSENRLEIKADRKLDPEIIYISEGEGNIFTIAIKPKMEIKND